MWFENHVVENLVVENKGACRNPVVRLAGDWRLAIGDGDLANADAGKPCRSGG